ncbi:RNA recognition motif 2 domain-containing protein [Rozella allomycis CSF55]|uniref:RNA recognition motif 2 domain-containing protein n=1 Tax=Rozella allomycis (strain CSF55) TaxID=988480 RepID=A0A075AS91_ROZAC|nr:RNA recognition motif 2 domain-containing protein [Rozella allomycis CSF55]|eukprot:EPZ33098.1 RNA recognition motif 2 domain-containing protein [Rozella allomycis CSF55]
MNSYSRECIVLLDEQASNESELCEYIVRKHSGSKLYDVNRAGDGYEMRVGCDRGILSADREIVDMKSIMNDVGAQEVHMVDGRAFPMVEIVTVEDRRDRMHDSPFGFEYRFESPFEAKEVEKKERCELEKYVVSDGSRWICLKMNCRGGEGMNGVEYVKKLLVHLKDEIKGMILDFMNDGYMIVVMYNKHVASSVQNCDQMIQGCFMVEKEGIIREYGGHPREYVSWEGDKYDDYGERREILITLNPMCKKRATLERIEDAIVKVEFEENLIDLKREEEGVVKEVVVGVEPVQVQVEQTQVQVEHFENENENFDFKEGLFEERFKGLEINEEPFLLFKSDNSASLISLQKAKKESKNQYNDILNREEMNLLNHIPTCFHSSFHLEENSSFTDSDVWSKSPKKEEDLIFLDDSLVKSFEKIMDDEEEISYAKKVKENIKKQEASFNSTIGSTIGTMNSAMSSNTNPLSSHHLTSTSHSATSLSPTLNNNLETSCSNFKSFQEFSPFNDSMIYSPPKQFKSSNKYKQPNEVDLWSIEKGIDTRTTCMIRNIPNKYTQQMLIEFINETHAKTYDFLYLRMDFKNRCNVGYAFINFIDPKFIVSFADRVCGKKWTKFNSDKICSLSYANIQGKNSLIEKFRNSNVMEEEPSYRPKIFYSSGPMQGLEEPFPLPNNNRNRQQFSPRFKDNTLGFDPFAMDSTLPCWFNKSRKKH